MQTLEDLPFVGGAAALDFTNTAEERGHPLCGDVLSGPHELAVWGSRYGICHLQAGDSAPAREFRRAIEARELLYRLWFARVHGGGDDPDDLALLAGLAAAADAAGSLSVDGARQLSWRWDPARLASVRHVAVASALTLLSAPTPPRLKQCPGDHCGWFFLDATKAGNRRWCEMGGCGQDAKTARRRQRRSPGSK